MKIKNRSHNDQAVAFQPLSQSSPFRVVQALVEVKSNCYVTVPIQVVKSYPTAFLKENSEAIYIRNFKGILLNSKREYLQCLIPALEASSTKEIHRQIDPHNPKVDRS